MKAFEGAIHLAKEATENIFTKVEETAVSVIASTILGTDERIVTEPEAKPEVTKEAEVQKFEEAPAQEKVTTQGSGAQTGKAAATETDIPRERENEIKRLQSELEGFQERYSMLSHKLAEVQRDSKEEVEKVTQQLVELGMKLEEERRIYGREIVALTDQVIAERNRSSKEKELMDVEWKSLQMQIQKWEEIVTEKELENFQLRRQVKEKEAELQKFREEIAKKSAEKKEKKKKEVKEWPKEGNFSENLKPQQTETKWEKPAEQLSTEEKPKEVKEWPKEGKFSESLKPQQTETKWEKPAEQLSTEEKAKEWPKEGKFAENLKPQQAETKWEEIQQEKPKEGAFSENLKPLQAEAKWEKPEETQQEKTGEKLPTEEGEFSENLQPLSEQAEHEEAVEHPLSQEDIQQKLSHKAVPAVRAGGKRIKQSQTGPHITHKTSLVEQRDDKKLLEAFRESPEEMSKQLQVIEAIQEAEMKLVKRDVKMAGKNPTETKMFASTYFPPVPKRDENQKVAIGGLNNFTVPMHGRTK